MMNKLNTATVSAMHEWRRQIHSNPELAFNEHQTSNLVAQELSKMGIDVHRGLGQTGVVGSLRNGDGPTIGLRADMDALPILELGSTAHKSRHQGVMHACGHDGHTAMLLGAVCPPLRNCMFSAGVNMRFLRGPCSSKDSF